MLKTTVITSFYIVHKTAEYYWAFCTLIGNRPNNHQEDSKLDVQMMTVVMLCFLQAAEKIALFITKFLVLTLIIFPVSKKCWHSLEAQTFGCNWH